MAERIAYLNVDARQKSNNALNQASIALCLRHVVGSAAGEHAGDGAQYGADGPFHHVEYRLAMC